MLKNLIEFLDFQIHLFKYSDGFINFQSWRAGAIYTFTSTNLVLITTPTLNFALVSVGL